jgi:predicted protein tyrosine phosphatase
MRVTVLSNAEIEAGGAEGAHAIISLCGSTDISRPELSTALIQATGGESARLLRLCFDDLGMEQFAHFRGPTMAQISDAIDFGRSVADGRDFFDGPIVGPPLVAVHSEHGRSRSSAIALALLADYFGSRHESEAVNTLLRSDLEDRMCPNPMVVDLTDSCLFRYGHLLAALVEQSPRFALRRALWRKLSADPERYRESIRQVVMKRGRGT